VLIIDYRLQYGRNQGSAMVLELVPRSLPCLCSVHRMDDWLVATSGREKW